MKTVLILMFVCMSFYTNYAQNMSDGFEMLENGKFKSATFFFEEVLKKSPENITARLCHARALGLNENPKKSQKLFFTLINEYPNNFELKLNYAESFLWCKDFKKGLEYYLELQKTNPDNVVVLIGLSNAYANLKQYKSAKLSIDKALEVEPSSLSILNSKKHIYKALAFLLMKEKDYTNSLHLLNEILVHFPSDTDVLLDKANVFLQSKRFLKANSTLNSIQGTVADSIRVANARALLAYQKGKNNEALKYCAIARDKLIRCKDEKITKATQKRYVEALLWNKKYKTAKNEIVQLEKLYGEKAWIILMKADLYMRTMSYQKAQESYTQLLNESNVVFNANLGLANAYFANKSYSMAYKGVRNTLHLFPKQADALKLLNSIKYKFSPSVKISTDYIYDSGDNTSIDNKFRAQMYQSSFIQTFMLYHHRQSENHLSNNKAIIQLLFLGGSYQVNSKVIIKANVGYSLLEGDTSSKASILGGVEMETVHLKYQTVTLGLKREQQYFNANLMSENLKYNKIFLKYHLFLNPGVGCYMETDFSSISDGNQRQLFFVSLYKKLSSNPVSKLGINYQYISFMEQRNAIYFSPDTFNAYELFFNLNKEEISWSNRQLFYQFTGALGYQYIQSFKKQVTYRLQTSLGYRFSNQFKCSAVATTSNIASASISGFRYTNFGLSAQWSIAKKSKYYKNLFF